MKIHKLIYILIYFFLFKYTYQVLEEGNYKTDNKSLTGDESSNLKIDHPMSFKDTINVKIESKNENLKNYYFKYFFTQNNKDSNIISDKEKYFKESNETMLMPKVNYIKAEMKHKIDNNSIILKSEDININNNFILNNTYHIFNEENAKNSFEEKLKNNSDYNYKLIIFYSIICLASISSIILIIVDYKEDKKIENKNCLSKKERAKEEYQALKNTFINKNVVFFSFFLMKYNYPIFNIFTVYNFNHARYIRFCIELIKILLNYLICIFFIKVFNNYNFEENTLVFFYSLFGSFIIYILTELLTRKVLGFDKKRKDIWKPKFESIRKYIFYNVKKDKLFNSKWLLIRNRIILYTRICGKTILKNKPNTKYKIYIDNKNIYNNSKINENISNNNSILSSQNEDEKLIDTLSEKLLSNNFNLQANRKSNLINYNNQNIKKDFLDKMNENNTHVKFCIEKSVQSFSFSKLGENNLKLKTVQKIEDIRNRYILKRKESKFDDTLEVTSFVKSYNYLEIEPLENYTYISIDSFKNPFNNTSSELYKIFINIYITFVLLFLLVLVELGLIYIIDSINDIDNIDLDIIFINASNQVIAFNFIVNYIISLCISIFIFNCYGLEKKNFIYKMVFKIFVEKYIKYIYRIRLLMIKYNKELDFIN